MNAQPWPGLLLRGWLSLCSGPRCPQAERCLGLLEEREAHSLPRLEKKDLSQLNARPAEKPCGQGTLKECDQLLGIGRDVLQPTDTGRGLQSIRRGRARSEAR